MNNKTALTILSAGLIVSATIGFTMISNAAQAQSFSCARAEVPSEMAICNNENLIFKDERLANLFADALVQASQANNASSLSIEHSIWLKRRNDCGADFNCLEKRYEERIKSIGLDL